MKHLFRIIILLMTAGLVTVLVHAQTGYEPQPQTPELRYNEARLIYFSNLEREKAGVPPMRANLQLNQAARWFSWDSVAHRSKNFCGHKDTQGNYADRRTRVFGYLGGSGAENSYCGYTEPAEAVAGWMESGGHRLNLIDPNTREAGGGYYLGEDDFRGYEVMDFGHDPDYAPLIINNEALTTAADWVNLYIYDREPGNLFSSPSPSVDMQISNDACFSGVQWEPYSANRVWTLASGPSGWRTVYVRTRDAFGRVLSASDMIWYGSGFTYTQLDDEQLSTTKEKVTLYGLESGGLPLMQFSPGWLGDDTAATFEKLWGDGQRVQDPDAWGGTAFRLETSGTSVWLYQYQFIQQVPLTAYVRLKVDNNRSNGEVARVSITGGHSLGIRGTDFSAAGQYQEFPVDFSVPAGEDFLTIQVDRTADAQVYFDAVTLYTQPVSFSSRYDLALPGGNYRGQGIWVRYLDGEGQFTAFQMADSIWRGLEVQPEQVNFLVARDHSAPEVSILRVISTCTSTGWRVESAAGWLAAEADGNSLRVRVLPDNLPDGDSQSSLTLIPDDGSDVITIPVRVRVVAHLEPLYLPLLD